MSHEAFAKAEAWAPYAGGRKAPLGSLVVTGLSETMSRYRREVAKRYRVVDFEQIGRLLPAGLFTISTKLDGELWFLVKQGTEVVLASYNGRLLHGTPLVREAARALAGSPDLVLAGELVAVPKDGRPRVQHVASALGSSELEPSLRFFPFDLVQDGDKDAGTLPYKERYARLTKLFGEGDAPSDRRVVPVTSVEGDGAAVASYFRAWVQPQLFEGLVVRAESGVTFKIKPTFTIDAVVVAYGDRRTAGAGVPVTEMRELTLALMNDDGTFQIIGPVGGGFDAEQRVAWRDRLSRMEAPSSFRMANREGTLCRFVRPEVVVEVKCSDLIETDSNDAPIARMSLRYDPEAGYAPAGDARVPALLFPVFVRERADKRVDLGSVGLEQLTSRLPADLVPWERGGRTLPDAVVLRRAVWTKAGGAVRKYVLIETRKGRADGYAPFVAYFTDYAPGRAEPLKTSLRVASTLESVERHVTVWIEENVKRGWAPAGAVAGTASPDAPTKGKTKEEAGAPAGEAEARPKAKKPAAKKAKSSPVEG